MKLTRQQAINEFCKSCIYDSKDSGTWRDQTSNCTMTECSLFEYRPLNSNLRTVQKQEKINAMTDKQRQAYELQCEKAKERLHSRKG